MESLPCPYCGQQKRDEPVDQFAGCRICGFKSAMVRSDDGILMIVDRRMPYLQRRCEELSEMNPECKIIVDRRITQDPHDVPDRRLLLNLEDS